MQTASSILQFVGIFAIPIGLALFVAVVLYVDALRLHYEEEARIARRMAENEAGLKQRPSVPTRPVLLLPAPHDFTVTRDGTVIPRAAA